MTALRCFWCGRFGARPVTYRLYATTRKFTNPLCPLDEAFAVQRTERASATHHHEGNTPQ